MKNVTEINTKTKFKKLKSYSIEEVLKAGGTSEFGKKIGLDPKKLLSIKGEGLSDDEYRQALDALTK